jgi:hypothetical protein
MAAPVEKYSHKAPHFLHCLINAIGSGLSQGRLSAIEAHRKVDLQVVLRHKCLPLIGTPRSKCL